MKKSILFFTSATAMLTIATVVSFDTEVQARPDGISGHSGAVSTCQSCHQGIANVVQNGSTSTLSSDIPAEGYTPGAVYNMALTIHSKKSKVGFNFRAQNSSGDLAGALSNVSSNAQITNSSTFGAIVGELTHNINNTISGGKKVVTFQWTAPVAGTGDVSYHGIVATGVNARISMDSLNKLKVVFKENTVTGIKDVSAATTNFSVLPTSTNDYATISYDLKVPAQVYLKLYDTEGHVVEDIFQGQEAAGAHSREINVSKLREGSYMIWMSANGKITTERIVVVK